MSEKPLFWMGSSRRDLKRFPKLVKTEVGYALDLAQNGMHSPDAKQMAGVGNGVYEVVSNYDGDTYRSVYTIQFPKAVYVLHAFQKKSHTGIKTPREDIAVIETRLKSAQAHYKQKYPPPGKAKKGLVMARKKQEKNVKVEASSGNVFADLGLADAGNHKVKAQLVRKIQRVVAGRKLTQAQTSALLGLHQPDVSKLLRGHFGSYSMDRLMAMLVRLGQDVEIVVKAKPARRIRESEMTVTA